MRLVAFADLRSNPWALEAILARVKRLGEADVWCLGNAVGAGPDPARTVETLRKRGVQLVRGPLDLAALGQSKDAALAAEGDAVARRLAPADLAYLRNASPPRRLRLGKRQALLTSDPSAVASGVDLLFRPGPRTGIDNGPFCVVALGSAGDNGGEAPVAVWDPDTDEVRIEHVAWTRP